MEGTEGGGESYAESNTFGQTKGRPDSEGETQGVLGPRSRSVRECPVPVQTPSLGVLTPFSDPIGPVKGLSVPPLLFDLTLGLLGPPPPSAGEGRSEVRVGPWTDVGRESRGPWEVTPAGEGRRRRVPGRHP